MSFSISILTAKLPTIEAQLDNDIGKMWIQSEKMKWVKRIITWIFLMKININIGNKRGLKFLGSVFDVVVEVVSKHQ